MSYHETMPITREGRIGKAIYMAALADRRGFRDDQIGIDDAAIWLEIFEELGSFAIKMVEAK